MAKPNRNDAPPGPFASEYPNIAQWVEDGGYVEIGRTSDELPAFVKALDEGGMIWEGETEYPTLDTALRAMDAGIAEWLGENS